MQAGQAIGHQSSAVAEQHYDDMDVLEAAPADTWDRSRGENFADLFARLCPEPKSPHPTGKPVRQAVTGSFNGLPASSGR